MYASLLGPMGMQPNAPRMKLPVFSFALIASGLLAISGPPSALAQVATPLPKASASADTPAGDAADYAKLVKGADQQTGLFTIWRKDGKVYLELRDDQFDTDFLEHIVPANGLGGFGFHSGDQFAQNGRLVRFHLVGKSVAMIWPHSLFLATPGTAQATAVHESTADSVEAVLPVVAANAAGKSHLLDASPLLGDLLDLTNNLNGAVGAEHDPSGSYHLDPTRTYFGPTKDFPQNVIVEADQTFASAKPGVIDTVPDARFVQMRVKYNFSQILSSPDYMPRLYDDRVGYWEDPHVAFDRDSERDNGRWYVLRWNVEASDPAQKMSPAKKPIVFYLDRSIPPEYRPAVRDGIMEWNKAFERIGVSNAVQVLDPPDDPAWDPDDIRYSVVRWVTDAPSEFGAEAQIVWDPRTGEIFRGGVLLDSNLGRQAKISERILLDALSFPAAAPAAAAGEHGVFEPGHDELAFGRGLAEQSAFGTVALSLMGDQNVDAFVYQRLKAVTLHEVGHDFGLSHNFIAHNAYSEAQLKSERFTKANGTSASVMDYWPVNLWPKGTSSGTWFPLTLGPYDYHVIHWGYAPVHGATTPQAEVPTLSRWASAATDPRYAFAGDEDGGFNGHAVDPRTAPFVLSNRPLDWCGTQLDMTHGFISRLDRRFPKVQQPWDDERFAFLALFGRYATCARTLTHYVAAEHLTRGRLGDPGVTTALSPVPRAEEQKAYAMLDKYVFDESAWRFSPTTLRRLVYEEYMPFSNFGYDPTPRHDVPIVAMVGALQAGALTYMYSPLVLQRLADMPTKAGPGTTMTLADLFAWTQAAIFRDVTAGRPAGSQIHRNLQRRYARMLAAMITAPAAGTPLDAQALARVELVDLGANVHRSLARKDLDLQTRAHLSALATDVERALDARTVIPAT
jgi:hypothetical protein